MRIESRAHAPVIHHMHCNSRRAHTSLRVTPDTEAGIADDIWTTEEMPDKVSA
jgi:hypothetical protein